MRDDVCHVVFVRVVAVVTDEAVLGPRIGSHSNVERCFSLALCLLLVVRIDTGNARFVGRRRSSTRSRCKTATRRTARPRSRMPGRLSQLSLKICTMLAEIRSNVVVVLEHLLRNEKFSAQLQSRTTVRHGRKRMTRRELRLRRMESPRLKNKECGDRKEKQIGPSVPLLSKGGRQGKKQPTATQNSSTHSSSKGAATVEGSRGRKGQARGW